MIPLEERRKLVETAPARRLVAIDTLIAILKKRGATVRYRKMDVLSGNWGFNLTVNDTHVRIACKTHNAGRLAFSVGDYDRHKAKKHYPEPKAGFDYDKIADAVESWATYLENKQIRVRTQAKLDLAAKVAKSRLFANNAKLQPYDLDVEFTGTQFKVDLRCDTIAQVESILRTALAAGVEP